MMKIEDLQKIYLIKKQAKLIRARENFSEYRKLLNRHHKPVLNTGWFRESVENDLKNWYKSYLNGDRPVLLLFTPPQHGKSLAIIDFISWITGKNPELKIIFASFSERLGVRANLRLQRIYDSWIYKQVFPNTRIYSKKSDPDATQHLRNREILEFVSASGYFRNTTVNGAVTGETLDIGIIDDPVKGREEANSQIMRDKIWDWFRDDFWSRFSDLAGLIVIMTRWHIDDLAERIIKSFPNAKICKYKAIADNDEKYRKEGEPLFPELKSLEFLLARKAAMFPASWRALYQADPVNIQGNVIKEEFFRRYKILPIIRRRIIFADTALKTSEANDYTVFQEWGISSEKQIYLIDMIRGKWESPEMLRRAYEFWRKARGRGIEYGVLSKMVVEDKVSGTGLIQTLKKQPYRIPVFGKERNIDKWTRVESVLPQIESGFVYIPENAEFTSGFIDECVSFRADMTHKYDDQIDPMCDAIEEFLVRETGFAAEHIKKETDNENF